MSDAIATAPRGLRLFAKLLILTLLIGLVPLLALSFAMLDTNAAALRNVTRQLHLSLASDANRAVEAELAATRTELTGIGQLLLAPGLGDDQTRLTLAGAKVTSSHALDYAAIYDPGGKMIVALKATEAGPIDPPRQLTGEILGQLGEGKLTPGAVRTAALATASTPVRPLLPLYVALYLNGERKLIVGTAIDLTPLCKAAADLNEQRLGGVGSVLVVNEKRELVVAPDPERVAAHESLAAHGIFSAIVGNMGFRQKIGLSPEFTQDGVEMLGALEAIPEQGWAVIVQEPRAVAYHSLIVMRQSVIALALLVALAAAISGVVFARRLAKPIAQLEEASRAIGARHFEKVPADVSSRGDEVGSLGRAFDSMAVDLRASEKKLIKETEARASLSRYLPGDVVELILNDPGRLKLGGERREITVLFADVVAFTKLSEQHPPELIVALLNELFTFATEIVERRGGIVDKFIGDCAMAVWGTPDTKPDDAERAVMAASDLRRWLDTANRKWKQKFGVEIQMAMGLHTGPAVAGNIGSERRMEYTVIGDTVNLAARLEGKAAPGQILISNATRLKLPDDLPVNALGEAKLAGRAQSVEIFEVLE
jgi:adenylate cyclase